MLLTLTTNFSFVFVIKREKDKEKFFIILFYKKNSKGEIKTSRETKRIRQRKVVEREEDEVKNVIKEAESRESFVVAILVLHRH